MSKRFTDTRKYRKGLLRGLQGAYKLLWDYLYHECDHAGIWEKDFELAQLLLGKDMAINEADALRFFNEGEERIRVIDGGRKWAILPFVEFQYGLPLNPENKAHASVLRSLEKHGIKGLARGMHAPKDKEKDTDKDKDRPTTEQVAAYCKERGNRVDPEKWMAYYLSNGWKVGKNPMKDWKAAVRTWEKSEFNQPPKPESESWIEKASREAQEKAAARAVTP